MEILAIILNRDIYSVHLQASFTVLHVDNIKPLTTHLHCKESPDIQKSKTATKRKEKKKTKTLQFVQRD